MVLSSNFYIKIKDLPFIMQYISDWAHTKFVYENTMILVYGRGRCAPDEQSIVLMKFNINDHDLTYNYYYLASYAIFLIINEYIALFLIINWDFKRLMRKIGIKSTIESENNNNNNNNNSVEVDVVDTRRKVSSIMKGCDNLVFKDNKDIIEYKDNTMVEESTRL